MAIFTSAINQRDLYRGYGDRRGSQRRANLFSARLGSRMKQWGELSKTNTMELTSDFANPNFRDIREERDVAGIRQAEKFSEKAVANLQKSKLTAPALSEGSYIKKTMERRQALQQSKRALEKANEFYSNIGSTFRFDETGYTRLDPSADKFYTEFDEAVERRKQEYAEMYGAESFDDLGDSYAQFGSDRWNQMGEVGQRDIMDMVMSDITGMSYEDLVELNAYHVAAEGHYNEDSRNRLDMRVRYDTSRLEDYTSEQLEGLREFYASSGAQGIKAANKLAAAEDESRRESAIASQRATIASQQKRKKTASEELSKSSEEIQLQLRELDEDFMKNIGSFRSAPKKRKVPKVSFTEGRPI